MISKQLLLNLTKALAGRRIDIVSINVETQVVSGRLVHDTSRDPASLLHFIYKTIKGYNTVSLTPKENDNERDL